MPLDLLIRLTEFLMYVMQASVVVPLVVVWRRKRQFPDAIKLFSWYVYLSLVCSIGAKLGQVYLHNNLFILIGFNVGKVLLFAAMYSLVMPTRKQLIKLTTLIGIAIVIAVMFYDAFFATYVSRVVQCAILAGFAILYMDHSLTHSGSEPGSQNPYWLLSVGQLIYSAVTVTGFSLDSVMKGISVLAELQWLCLVGSGLTFNYFMTLAFLRAKRAPLSPAPASLADRQVVGVPANRNITEQMYGMKK